MKTLYKIIIILIALVVPVLGYQGVYDVEKCGQYYELDGFRVELDRDLYPSVNWHPKPTVDLLFEDKYDSPLILDEPENPLYGIGFPLETRQALLEREDGWISYRIFYDRAEQQITYPMPKSTTFHLIDSKADMQVPFDYFKVVVLDGDDEILFMSEPISTDIMITTHEGVDFKYQAHVYISSEGIEINEYDINLNTQSCQYKQSANLIFFVIIPSLFIGELLLMFFTDNDRMFVPVLIGVVAFYTSMILFSSLGVGIFIYLLSIGFRIIQYREMNRSWFVDYVIPILHIISFIILLWLLTVTGQTMYMTIASPVVESYYVTTTLPDSEIYYMNIFAYVSIPLVAGIEILYYLVKNRSNESMFTVFSTIMMVVAYILLGVYFMGILVFSGLIIFLIRKHKEEDNTIGLVFSVIYILLFLFAVYVKAAPILEYYSYFK